MVDYDDTCAYCLYNDKTRIDVSRDARAQTHSATNISFIDDYFRKR